MKVSFEGVHNRSRLGFDSVYIRGNNKATDTDDLVRGVRWTELAEAGGTVNLRQE